MKPVAIVLAAFLAGFAGAAVFAFSGLGHGATRAYLVANPDILPAMAQAYDRAQARERLAGVGGAVAKPFPGAVLGNPQGTKTLVMFSDYACTFCRQSLAEIDKLIAADPALRVVVRELPILEGSEPAARMALAAAEQGRYAAFHNALFALGPPSEASVARAAGTAGLDLQRARQFAASRAVDAELSANAGFAHALQIGGTPSWVAGGQFIEGYVPAERLAEALDSPA